MVIPAPAIRVHVDTSVFGGVFDFEFDIASREFFKQVADGRFVVVTSAVIDDEIRFAPAPVRELYALVAPLAEVVAITPGRSTWRKRISRRAPSRRTPAMMRFTLRWQP